MLRWKCEKCGKSLKAPEKAVDQRARCPKCGFSSPVMPDPPKQAKPMEPPPDAVEVQWQPPVEPILPEPTSGPIRRRIVRRTSFAEAFLRVVGGIAIAFFLIAIVRSGTTTLDPKAKLEEEGYIWRQKSIGGMMERGEYFEYLKFCKKYKDTFGREFDER